jgi:hypothetical protein
VTVIHSQFALVYMPSQEQPHSGTAAETIDNTTEVHLFIIAADSTL